MAEKRGIEPGVVATYFNPRNTAGFGTEPITGCKVAGFTGMYLVRFERELPQDDGGTPRVKRHAAEPIHLTVERGE